MKKERLKYVDLLRLLAMIPVVACHWTRGLEYSGVSSVSKVLPDTVFSVYLGSFGVAIFFVLSGISLMYTYDGKLNIKKYFMKRFKGIYPMFWIAWIIAFMYYFVINHGSYYTDAPKWTLIWTVLGTDGYFSWFGPNWYLLGEWFLGCLIILYLLFPILKWGVEKKPVITAVVVVVVYVVVSIFYNGIIPKEVFFVLRIPEFVFGMYFVKYVKNVNWISGVVSLLVLILFEVIPLDRIMSSEAIQNTVVYRNTIVGIASVIFVTWICSFIKSERFFSACASISKYCYPVFLTHHVIIAEFTKNFSGRELGIIQNYIAFLIACVLTGIASVLLYKLDKKIKKMLFVRNRGE